MDRSVKNEKYAICHPIISLTGHESPKNIFKNAATVIQLAVAAFLNALFIYAVIPFPSVLKNLVIPPACFHINQPMVF